MEREAKWEGFSVVSVAFFTYEFWQKAPFTITCPENAIFIEVVTGLNETDCPMESGSATQTRPRFTPTLR